ncbi:hypothetical protein LNQ81_15345 [Myroides sp. M-43]|uniref:hypothetical protein n=1 Tax=Myroides oncorhynchi TaxID=2893756 RepID=UPI001E327BB4|nr:hypothetical protein [Myroides oncorhynchi]MCC9044050.1 hypothetical protein [Myroides oncorhynchi]
MDIIMYYFYYLSSHFEGFSPVVRMTVFLTMLLGGLYILSLLKIGIVAYKAKVEKNRYQKVKDKYGKALYYLLHSHEDKTTTQILDYLGLSNSELSNWEKAHITNLLVNMIKAEDEV